MSLQSNLLNYETNYLDSCDCCYSRRFIFLRLYIYYLSSRIGPPPPLPKKERLAKIQTEYTRDVLDVRIEKNLLVWDEVQIGKHILTNESDINYEKVWVPYHFVCFDGVVRTPFHLILKFEGSSEMSPGGTPAFLEANQTKTLELWLLSSEYILSDRRKARAIFREYYEGDGIPFGNRSSIQTASIYRGKGESISDYEEPDCFVLDNNKVEKVKAVKLNITN